MKPDAVIVGIGMFTAVGQTARQTATSVRAGLTGFCEMTWIDKAYQPFVGSFLPDDAVPPLDSKIAAITSLTSREQRLISLASEPLKEATAEWQAVGRPAALILGAPEQDQTFRLPAEKLLEYLSMQSGVQFDVASSTVIFKGRSSGLLALQEALSRLTTGACEQILVGGVDSFKDLYLLGSLDMNARISSDQNHDGFIPGEGAGFLLLTLRATAERNHLQIRGTVMAVSTGFESGHLSSQEPYRGEGLAKTFDALFASVGSLPDTVPTVYASFNGENYWAKEWGVSAIRQKDKFAEDVEIEHPADCIGDTGAASGPLMVGMAVIGIENAYRKGPVLCFASSDGGDRAAAIVAAGLN